MLSNPALEKKNARSARSRKTIINNVVTHAANLQDADVNAATT